MDVSHANVVCRKPIVEYLPIHRSLLFMGSKSTVRHEVIRIYWAIGIQTEHFSRVLAIFLKNSCIFKSKQWTQHLPVLYPEGTPFYYHGNFNFSRVFRFFIGRALSSVPAPTWEQIVWGMPCNERSLQIANHFLEKVTINQQTSLITSTDKTNRMHKTTPACCMGCALMRT